jgi:hypothetical protein
MALTTGRYVFPHPAIIANNAVTPAIAAAARPRAAAARTVLCFPLRFLNLADCASTRCKPAPTFPPMLTTFKTRL